MRLVLPLICIFNVFCIDLVAQNTYNWSQHVAPIFYQKCVNCHQSNNIAPFELISYQSAFDNQLSIQYQVTNKSMPPWPPDPNYTHFAHERTLTDQEINIISEWVNTGAQQGDPNLAPEVPTFNPNSNLGEPDLVIKLPTFTVNSNTDLYQCFVVPSNITEQRYIKAIQVEPGNKSIVHHVLVYQDTTGNCAQLDAQQIGLGYTGSGGGVGEPSVKLISGWVPGSITYSKFPDNMGIRFRANNDIVTQIHYPEGSLGLKDSTTIKIYFTSSNQNIREVYVAPILNHSTSLVNGPLFIPANDTKHFKEKVFIPINLSLLSVSPHMHLIGKKIQVYGVNSQNDSIPLIKINNWDFHWQGGYTFSKIQKIPAFSTLYADAVYDNTLNNPNNPNNPLKDVKLGEATTDEMMLVFFNFLMYQPGDENISLELENTTSVTPTILFDKNKIGIHCYPNPANLSTQMLLYLPNKQNISIHLYNIHNQLVKTVTSNNTFNKGYSTFNLPVNELSNGVYFVQVTSQNEQICTRLIVAK